jgi:hypothetical protein
MFRLAIPPNTKHMVALIVLLTALLFAFAPRIGAQTKAQHCVGQLSPIQTETGSSEHTELGCFSTIEEAWASIR